MTEESAMTTTSRWSFAHMFGMLTPAKPQDVEDRMSRETTDLDASEERNGGRQENRYTQARRVSFRRQEPYSTRRASQEEADNGGEDSESESGPRNKLRRKLSSGRAKLPLFDWRPVMPAPPLSLHGVGVTDAAPSLTKPAAYSRPVQFSRDMTSPGGNYVLYAPHAISLPARQTVRVDMEVQVRLPVFTTLEIKRCFGTKYNLAADPSSSAVAAMAQNGGGGGGKAQAEPVQCVKQSITSYHTEWMPLCITLRNDGGRDVTIPEGEAVARVRIFIPQQPVENPPISSLSL